MAMGGPLPRTTSLVWIQWWHMWHMTLWHQWQWWHDTQVALVELWALSEAAASGEAKLPSYIKWAAAPASPTLQAPKARRTQH
jgi:hypothetical protein